MSYFGQRNLSFPDNYPFVPWFYFLILLPCSNSIKPFFMSKHFHFAVWLFVFHLFFMQWGFTQDRVPLKKLQQVSTLASKGKLEKAGQKMEKLLHKYPHDGQGWNYLFKIRYMEWEESKQSDMLFKNFTIQVKDSTGQLSEAKNDSLVKSITSILGNFKLSEGPYQQLLYTARKATLLSHETETAEMMFRMEVIDYKVDTGISDTAFSVFKIAEEYFFQENYEKAAWHYKKALELDSTYYLAAFYLGDAYYFLADYPRAIDAFSRAKHREPFLMEPRKFLYDAYLKNGSYDLALEEAISSMLLLPEHSMMERLRKAARRLKRNFDVAPTNRTVFPNTYRLPPQYANKSLRFTDPYPLVASGPWIHYEQAKEKMEMYCDEKGIINKKNDLSKSPYLEVFSWEEMLKNSNDPSLETARRMQEEGYLDCYVFITCFHFDLLEQYKDFAARNEQKIRTYFRKYME